MIDTFDFCAKLYFTENALKQSINCRLLCSKGIYAIIFAFLSQKLFCEASSYCQKVILCRPLNWTLQRWAYIRLIQYLSIRISHYRFRVKETEKTCLKFSHWILYFNQFGIANYLLYSTLGSYSVPPRLLPGSQTHGRSKIGPLQCLHRRQSESASLWQSLITVWCTHAHSISLPSETMKPNVLRFVIPSFCYRVSFPFPELLLHPPFKVFFCRSPPTPERWPSMGVSLPEFSK